MHIPINSPLLNIAFVVMVFGFYSDFRPYSNTSSIEIGKQIYTTGIGTNNENIIAINFGKEMSATIYACSKCHGECGIGQMQQGMDIPDIRRASYQKRHFQNSDKLDNSRKINSKLKRLIALGINHEGEKVNSMMPTYKMSLINMDHLLAYLAILGTDENCVDK